MMPQACKTMIPQDNSNSNTTESCKEKTLPSGSFQSCAFSNSKHHRSWHVATPPFQQLAKNPAAHNVITCMVNPKLRVGLSVS